MTSWPVARLESAATLNPRLKQRPGDDELVSFLAMADVETDGSTSSGIDRPFREVSKGYTQFCCGDILVAKITPCFENGKIGQAATSRRAATGSTEFHVVRPDPKLLDGKYLHHFMRQPIIRVEGERQMTGSGGQRRVPEHYLAQLRILLPPIHEQRRIAAILDQADELQAKRRRVINLLDDLTRSIFLDMFGDPGVADSRWPRLTVSEVAHQVTDGEHITPVRENDGIKLLSARNIQDGFIDFSKVDYVSPAEYARISRRCNPQPGDVLLSCSGTIGRVALVEIGEPLSLVRSVALIKPNHEMVASDYLLNVLRMPALKNAMLRAANASSQANLFQGPIRALSVPIPPITLQEEFSRRFRSVMTLKATQTEDSRALSELFASLQARAFRNEL